VLSCNGNDNAAAAKVAENCVSAKKRLSLKKVAHPPFSALVGGELLKPTRREVDGTVTFSWDLCRSPWRLDRVAMCANGRNGRINRRIDPLGLSDHLVRA